MICIFKTSSLDLDGHTSMHDMEDLLKSKVPFFAANWPYITLTLAIALVLAFWLGRRRSDSTPKRILAQEHGEHPLSEFKEDVPDPDEGGATDTIHSPNTPHIPYTFQKFSEEEMISRSESFFNNLNGRRSIRHFSPRPVPITVIENIVKTAGTSPSGAHSEPWVFVVIKDAEVKAKIRDIIEQEEYLNYDHRMGDKWVKDLKFVRTSHEKPYLEKAPYIIIVFKSQYHIDEAGVKHPHYYYEISTAIASGILIAAIHNAGLVTVTTTPLNAGGQIRELLGRPSSEKVMLVLPVGYPSEDAMVPDVKRKKLEDIMILI